MLSQSFHHNTTLLLAGAVADLGGGGGTPGPCPPLLKPISTFAPPPFCTCAPPLFKPKKKMCRNTEMCRIPPPPPPFGTCATLDAGGAPKKKSVGVPPPPPPPPAHQLFWDLRDFRGWRRSEKSQCVVPPPLFFKSWIRPCAGVWIISRLGLARLSTLVALRKKSVGVPPPPPPLISFFGTCATFEAGGGPKKTSVLCPPPFFKSWIRPCAGVWISVP